MFGAALKWRGAERPKPLERLSFSNFESETFDSGEFFGGIGEQNHVVNAEGSEALCANAVESSFGRYVVDGVFVDGGGVGDGIGDGVASIGIAMDVE